MNPRAAINDLLPFQGSPFGQLGYFSKYSQIKYLYETASRTTKAAVYERRRWDSNPRPLAESLVFKTSSLNHSDTSPSCPLFSGN